VHKVKQVEGLSSFLEVPYVHALGIRSSLRIWAEDRCPIGDFSDETPESIAAYLGWSSDRELLMKSLCSVGILVEYEQGFRMPDWFDDDKEWTGFANWFRASSRN